MKFIDSSGVTFACAVTFEGAVSQTGDQAITGSVTASATVQGADLIATDDLTVGDDVAVTGDYTSAAGNITLTAGTLTAADLSITDDATITGDLVVNGAVNLTGADSITLPTGMHIVRTWTSGTIVHGDLTGGGAQDSVAVPAGSDGAFPAGIIAVGAYFETTGTATSSSGDTTGLTVSLSVGSSDYLAVGASILGAASKKENASGALMGGYRAADVPDVNFTALGGGSEDLADINALALRVVLKYILIA